MICKKNKASLEQSLCISWVAATAKQITNVGILHKYQVLRLHCSCNTCSAHLGAPASSPISSELDTTTEVTPHFDFSKLIINLWCFQLVTRTYISVWTSSLRFPVVASMLQTAQVAERYCSWKGCFTYGSAPNTWKYLQTWKGKPKYWVALESKMSLQVCKCFLSSLSGQTKALERAVPRVERDKGWT